ncbi:MAG: hypothetical protein KY464_03630 [Gemmatimonadetes bacterium]|nr:hypothetical protein [Gemmatimonadota bacterium]
MSANSTVRSSSAAPAAPSRVAAPPGIAGVLLAGLLLLAGCERGAGSGSAAAADTAADGLSQEQLQQQAQPMTREQAEQAGIMDTTEAEQPSPVGPDAAGPLVPLDTARPPSP